jgi:hypothetical protein
MAITLTKKVTATWTNGRPDPATTFPGGSETIQEWWTPFNDEMIAQEKTNGVYYVVDADTNYKLWADQTSAQAFYDKCVECATKLDRTSDLTVVIENF